MDEASWLRLAVFEGGFTAEAAAAVLDPSRWNPEWPVRPSTSSPDTPDPGFVERLEALVQAGRLQREPDPDGTARYRMDDAAREAAAARLEASGEEADVRREHAAHYLGLAHRCVENAEGGSLDNAALLREFGNIQAALCWIMTEACEEASAERRAALEEQGAAVFALTHACEEAGRMEDLEGLAFIAMGLAGLHAENEPENPWLNAMQEGDECWERGDLSGAEAAYRRGLEGAEDGLNVRTYEKLAALYAEQGRFADAVHQAQLGTEVARRADMEIVTAMALDTEARHRLRVEDFETAMAAATEALALVPDRTDPLRASARLTRAECLLHAGDLEGAAEEIQAVRRLLEPVGEDHNMGGFLAAQFRFWTVSAGFQARVQDREAEIDARRKAVACAHRLAGNWLVGGHRARRRLAKALKALSEALAASGLAEEAEQALAESRSLE